MTTDVRACPRRWSQSENGSWFREPRRRNSAIVRETDLNGGASRRRVPISVAAATIALLISGCGIGSVFGTGSSPDESQTSQEEPTPAPEVPAEPEPTPEPEEIVVVAEEPAEDDQDENDSGEGIPEDAAGGTIELSIESGGTERVFQYTADHCFVSPEYILAGGKGAEVGTGEASEVGISSSPAELIHEATGTYQAEGLISVRMADFEVRSDGRMITPSEHTIPSVFTYRHDDNSAHYVVAWFSEPGGADVGAGYVKVNCEY